MRTKTTYYAFDETEFDNETECLLYEQSLHRMAHGVQFFNEDRKFMRQPELEDIECYAMYMRIADAGTAEEFFDWLPQMISFEKPKTVLKNGQIFAYNCDNGEWDDMSELLDRIKAVVDDIKREAPGYADT